MRLKVFFLKDLIFNHVYVCLCDYKVLASLCVSSFCSSFDFEVMLCLELNVLIKISQSEQKQYLIYESKNTTGPSKQCKDSQ